MSEIDVIQKTALPVTFQSLLSDLKSLGVKPGDTLLIHSSLSSLGWVCGEEVTVLKALRAAVGETGTLVMPAHSSGNSDPAGWQAPPVPTEWVPIIRENLPPFDKELTPTRQMGRIAEAFRTLKGTLRSDHPQVSFCANGPLAAQITASHPLSPMMGPDSPLGALYRLKDAKVLLLGVGYGNSTSFHLAEALWGQAPMKREGSAVLQDGERRWVFFSDLAYDDEDFPDIGLAYEKAHQGEVHIGPAGLAQCRLFPLAPAVDFARAWMEEHREPAQGKGTNEDNPQGVQPPAQKTLYVSDLDGTLLNREDALSPRTIEVLHRLTKEGHLFSYATARSLSTSSKVTEGLSVSLPVIVYNGAFIMDSLSGRILSSCGFGEDEVEWVRALCREYGISPLVYSFVEGKESVSYLPSPGNQGLARYLSDRREDPRLRPISPGPDAENELFAGDVFYFTCISDKLAPLSPLFQELTGDSRFRCTLQQELYREEYWCEIMPAQATKAQAVLRLKKLLGCTKIVSFGDAINDLPLFQVSDECYAVENAVPQLKGLATGVIPSNEEDGVAYWLEKHVLTK